ncbi:MAG: biotin--[acetyl-CoA-carboxylase] ligase [Gammaproteobacteria bacterium]|nr:biotin--[acetyl-CoA-carboxylase] ligase [Gammaproteobacteria bacterium]
MILFNQEKIRQHLMRQDVVMHLFDKIDSTNQFLHSVPLDQTTHICLAEQQTAGRGRLQRNWHSPFGQNIYFSCRVFLKNHLDALSGLSLLAGLSVADTLQALHLPEKILLKWPNDVLYERHKLAGILIEIQNVAAEGCYIIIGIGINVNMVDDATSITQHWTSLKKMLDVDIDRNMLCAHLIDQLLRDLKHFESHGLEPFLPAWEARDYLLQKDVTLQSPQGIIEGIAQGIDGLGRLKVHLADGSNRLISSGDTTIVKKDN